MDVFADVLRRLKSATEASADLQARIECAISGYDYDAMRKEGYADRDLIEGVPLYLHSTDAAIHLVQSLLPGWHYGIGLDCRWKKDGVGDDIEGEEFFYCVLLEKAFEHPGHHGREIEEEHIASLPMAIVTALWVALISEEARQKEIETRSIS